MKNVITLNISDLSKFGLPSSTRFVAVSAGEPHDGNIWAGGDTWQACCDDLDRGLKIAGIDNADAFSIFPLEIVDA